jgi:hypothetical protein
VKPKSKDAAIQATAPKPPTRNSIRQINSPADDIFG